MISFILSLAVGIAVLIADQFTKHLVVANFQEHEVREFINGFIDLTYIRNPGGAWGMLSGNTWVLLGVSVAVMVICGIILVKYGIKNKLLHWALNLVMFGGVGNMIDRIFREDKKVVDFLHFEFWPDFPVFNVADCAIVIGAGLLILYFVIDTVMEYKNKKTAEKDCDGIDNADN